MQSELDSGHSGDNGDRDSLPPSTAARDGFDSCSGAEVKAGVADTTTTAAAAAAPDDDNDDGHHASSPLRLGMMDIRVRACNPWAAQPSWEWSALGYRWVRGMVDIRVRVCVQSLGGSAQLGAVSAGLQVG